MEVSKIIALNNTFWTTVFYTDVHVTESYQIHLLPEFKHIASLNAASGIRDPRSLSEIEDYMVQRKLNVSLFVDCFSPLHISFLKKHGYQYDQQSSEVWRVLNVDEAPCAETFLSEETSLNELSLLEIPFEERSVYFQSFLDISLGCNDVLELKDRVAQNILLKANSQHVKLLLLCYRELPVSTIALGLYEPYGFLCLAGTRKEYRGRGLFPYLRLKAAEIARDHGCRQVFSSTELGNSVSLARGAASGSKAVFYQYFWTKKEAL